MAHEDDYHGTRVEDPYRWLEKIGSEQTRAWVEAQNRLSVRYLQEVPGRSRLLARLRSLWNYERRGAPFRKGATWFFYRNDGLQEHSVLYSASSPQGAPRPLLDPNAFSDDGLTSVHGATISRDGKLVAYLVSRPGELSSECRVREVETGRDLADRLILTGGSLHDWSGDGSGFYYTVFPERKDPSEPLHSPRLRFHALGTSQADDPVVYACAGERRHWQIRARVSEDGRYLVVSARPGNSGQNVIACLDSALDGKEFVELFGGLDASYRYVGNDGSAFRFLTTADAPRGRIVEVDIGRPSRSDWKEIVPQSQATLVSAARIGDRLVAEYLEHACSRIRLFEPGGKPFGEVGLPGPGIVSGFEGTREDAETYYTYSGFTAPPTVYRLDLRTGESTLQHRPRAEFDGAAYETRQVFFESRDGTRVPMFLTARKGLRPTGNHPVYLYGYGGFSVSVTPSFSSAIAAWLEMGGVYAVANIRGGGEYGEDWHRAGMGASKQNVFDDFIAAAEWLVEHRYTVPSKLAIGGRSNGGLLVAACMVQRPELFGAALPEVGLMDMLRYQAGSSGPYWVSEYGSAETPEGFRILRSYSPLHNVRAGAAYPETLVTTSDQDYHVLPFHSYKFAAALQAVQAGPGGIYLRVYSRRGHGSDGTSRAIEMAADRWAFLARALEMVIPPAAPAPRTGS